MAKTGYKAYVLAVTQLGLGISPQGIKWCWRFAIPPEGVRARLPDLQRMGFIRPPKQRHALSAAKAEREASANARAWVRKGAKAEREASANARAERAIERMMGNLQARGWTRGARG